MPEPTPATPRTFIEKVAHTEAELEFSTDPAPTNVVLNTVLGENYLCALLMNGLHRITPPTSTDFSVHVWHLETHEHTILIAPTTYRISWGLSMHGDALALVRDENAWVFDVRTAPGVPLATYTPPDSFYFCHTSVTAISDQFVAATSVVRTQVAVWSRASGKVLHVITAGFGGFFAGQPEFAVLAFQGVMMVYLHTVLSVRVRSLNVHIDAGHRIHAAELAAIGLP